MPLKEVDLRGVYSMELRLDRDQVEHYLSMGLPALLRHVKRNPIKVNLYRRNGRNLLHIEHGHHRSKALLLHGVYEIHAVPIYEDPRDSMELERRPVKLKNVKELPREEYIRFLKSWDGFSWT